MGLALPLIAAAGLGVGAPAALGATGVSGAALGLSAAGTGLSAIGSIEQGSALSAMSNYQAQVFANNAKIAAQYAENATQTGESQAYAQGLKERQREQAITAGIAAGGINVNTGSAEQVRQSQRELGMLDVETVRQQAALQAYGYRTQQTSYQAQSQLETAQAGFETTAGWLGGAGALISGGANTANFGLLTGAIPGAASPTSNVDFPNVYSVSI